MKWTVLRLRAEAVTDEGWRKPVCGCGLLDKHGRPVPHGEPLWPQRWTCKDLYDLKMTDATMWEASYQGEPIIGGGYTFGTVDAEGKPKTVYPNYYEKASHAEMNTYLLCDPSLGIERLRSRIAKSDRLAIGVVGLHTDQNYYLLDVVCTRCTTEERIEHIFRLHRKWRPIAVGYEEYGLQADTVTLGQRMERENYRFTITTLGRTGTWHNLSKVDRIRTLAPQARQGRWWFPNPETPDRPQELADTIRYVVEQEWAKHPACQFDDMLDMLSRINDPDLGAVFPTPRQFTAPASTVGPNTTWMSA